MSVTVASMRLVAYKGFVDTRINFAEANVLVGANNAGKSTIVGALRLVAALLPLARRRAPDTRGITQGQPVQGWSVTRAAAEAAAFGDENVRYDFRNSEARVEAQFSNGVNFSLVWPERDDEPPSPPAFFFLTGSGRIRAASMRLLAQNHTPDIGVVPSLFPIEDRESRVLPETLRLNMTSRRTSRTFRNALLAVYTDHERRGDWEELTDFMLSLTPEIEELDVSAHLADRGEELDVFYTEPGGHERELVWAGDGLQIWLQSMYHLWRNRDVDVLVLDEPDVFLHPDLQRRLARTVFNKQWQPILATHSVEVLAEAPPGSAVWVDRARPRTERPQQDGALTQLGARLGSGLELGVARALRGGVALFVEGQDMTILSKLADTAGASRVALGAELAVIPLGGFDRHVLASAFAEVLAVLGARVQVRVILDRDLKSRARVDAVTAQIASSGAKVHVWHRKELESYVLDAGAISARTGLPLDEATALLEQAVDALKDDTRRALTGRRLEEGRSGAHNERTILRDAEDEFDAIWAVRDDRLNIVHPKRVIAAMNQQLQAGGLRTLTAQGLAGLIAPEDLPDEVVREMTDIEALLSTV